MSNDVEKTKGTGVNKKIVKKSSIEGKNKSKKDSNEKIKVKNNSNKGVKKINDQITLEEADSFYHVSLLAQAVCVIGVLTVSVLAIFENSFTVPVETLVGVTLIIMAYNNYKMFNRKFMTAIYLVFFIFCLFVGILGYFGVTL